jgi:methionyl-tRNA formyltransferase
MFSNSRIKNIIVLSQYNYGSQIIDILKKHSPSTSYLLICEKAELNIVSKSYLKDSRLLCFSSKIIVPELILENLGFGAFNIHPGPPHLPGWAPFCFAIYNSEKNFGVTFHKMTVQVDSGPIIAVNSFPIGENIVQSDLENTALLFALSLIEEWADKITKSPPLDILLISWGSIRATQKDFKKMCLIDERINKQEFHRRLRAFGNGDGTHYLHVNKQGRMYKLDLYKNQDEISEFISIHGVKFELQK